MGKRGKRTITGPILTIGKRTKYLIDLYFNGNVERFAKALRSTVSTVNSILYRGTIPQGDFIQRVVTRLGVEGTWYVADEGPMHRLEWLNLHHYPLELREMSEEMQMLRHQFLLDMFRAIGDQLSREAEGMEEASLLTVTKPPLLQPQKRPQSRKAKSAV